LSAIKDIILRNGRTSDYDHVISVMPDWWGGRDLTAMLPKVFFVHFHNTIYIAEMNDEFVGFLVGFLSQADDGVGYIHFVGVHPDYRKSGLGRRLYQQFYEACLNNNRLIVKACTSPVNRLSIAFHLRMGFNIEPGDGTIEGVPVTMDYLRKDDPKVLFRKVLKPPLQHRL